MTPKPFTPAELRLLRSADDVVDGSVSPHKPPTPSRRRTAERETGEAAALRRLRASRPQTDRELVFARLALDVDPALLPPFLAHLDVMLAHRLDLGHTLAAASIRERITEVHAILGRRRP